jgi:hypothetical protein
VNISGTRREASPQKTLRPFKKSFWRGVMKDGRYIAEAIVFWWGLDWDEWKENFFVREGSF